MARVVFGAPTSLSAKNNREAHQILMTVTVNGKPHSLPDGATLAALIEQLNFGPKRLAVEVNKELVTRAEWPKCILKEADTVEIVSFVGGG